MSGEKGEASKEKKVGGLTKKLDEGERMFVLSGKGNELFYKTKGPTKGTFGAGWYWNEKIERGRRKGASLNINTTINTLETVCKVAICQRGCLPYKQTYFINDLK